MSMSRQSNPDSSQQSSLSSFKLVLVVPGKHYNVLKSLCKAVTMGDGIYLWGDRERSHISIVEKIVEDGLKNNTLVLIYGTELGIVALGTIDRILDKELDKEHYIPFWCDEEKEGRILYEHRFTVKLNYIAKGVYNVIDKACLNPCEADVSIFDKTAIPQRAEIDRYLREKLKRKYQLLTGYITRLEGQEASLTVEFLKGKVLEGVYIEVPTRPTSTRKTCAPSNINLVEFAILLHLLSGKNLLLVGPPGSGKTSLLKSLLEKLGAEYIVETGNPDWTPFDTIGGVGIQNNVRKGFIVDAVEKCDKAIKGGKLFWLIMDEINRANVDLALGKFFTLLDPVYRLREPVRVGNLEVWVPLSFRVLATMNSYDRALLFKLGYALTRRFAVVNYTYLNAFGNYISEYAKSAETKAVLNALQELSKQDCADNVKLNYEVLLKELALCSNKLPNDCVTFKDFAEYLKGLESGENWRDRVFVLELPGAGILKLDNIGTCLAGKLNNLLLEFQECDVCPVQITPGVLADALKYMAVGVYTYKYCTGLSPLGELAKNPVSYALFLLDSAFASYVIPQLDVLADYVRREELEYRVSESGGRSLRSVLNKVAGELESTGLHYSASMVKRLAKGYHVL